MNSIVARGSFGMLAPADETLPVRPHEPLSKQAVPDEDLADFQDLANSAAYHSTEFGVFVLNDRHYRAQTVGDKIVTRALTASEFAQLQTVNR